MYICVKYKASPQLIAEIDFVSFFRLNLSPLLIKIRHAHGMFNFERVAYNSYSYSYIFQLDCPANVVVELSSGLERSVFGQFMSL